MKKLTISILKFIIDKVKRNKFIQNVFESPFDFDKFEKNGQFQDLEGNTFMLYKGLRTKIRPGWERMFMPKPAKIPPLNLNKMKTAGEVSIDKVKPILETLGKRLEESRVLDIGCHSGAASFAFAEAGAKEVVGSEFSGYKVESLKMGAEADKNLLNEANDSLKKMRVELSSKFTKTDRVTFVDDDICNSTLAPNSFDIICSWEVLEHLHDPKKAFKTIHSLLKSGGVTVQLYNPFFCINGGHSLCTLDFLWGHTRLNDAGFVKYLDEIRPEEKEKALSFYRKGVNRMTLHQLRGHVADSGLEVISIIPFTKEQHIKMVNEDILNQSVKNYPDLTLLDLVAPAIIVVARKN